MLQTDVTMALAIQSVVGHLLDKWKSKFALSKK